MVVSFLHHKGATMLCRLIAASAILFSLALPAFALNQNQPGDEALAAAAGRMKLKDYSGARKTALRSGDKGAGAFLLGMSCLRLELWEEAASRLGVAADSYPILADYALYNQGVALSKLARNDQALPPLYRLLKQYPESRLARPAMLLYAQTLAAGGYHKEAAESYAAFIDRYPLGRDSITALFGSALSREKLGAPAAAAQVFRGIWLNYPGSPLAEKASRELQRLAAAGTRVEPYTSAELYKRAGTLYDLGRYGQAADAYAELPLAGEPQEFASKLRLKLGQALFKAKRYQQAQATLSGLAQQGAGGNSANEATYWMARAIDKSGRQDEAYEIYLRLAAAPKGGSVSDDALLEAAYLKRYQRKWGEALPLFNKYLAGHPDQQRNATVYWEAAWASYQSRDFQGAAALLRKLADSEEMREKALYWLGKALLAAGDAKGSDAAFAALASDYPFGYYALTCNRWCAISEVPLPPKNLTDLFPMPAGFEREKALISLGLFEEAAGELSAKRSKNSAGAIRLYLEMGNYNGAIHALGREKPKRGEKETSTIFGINYPLAFRELVASNAAANAIPESLVYAIMRSESNFSPAVLSPVGAVGLMQIMPATAETISKGSSARLTTPDLNIRLGAKYLRDLLNTYGRNIPLAAAAYNAGPGNVKRWRSGFGEMPQDEFIENIPFRETREYVKKVIAAMELYQRLYRLPAYK
jgi:soluble lytic murein transglycosylase